MYNGIYIWDSVRSAQVNGRGAKVKVCVSTDGSFLARTFHTIVINDFFTAATSILVLRENVSSRTTLTSMLTRFSNSILRTTYTCIDFSILV